MANDSAVMLSEAFVQRVAKVVRDAEATAKGGVGKGRGVNTKPLEMVGISTTSFTGRVGKTPGFGMVQPYYDNGTELVIDPVQQPVKVKNWTGSTVASGVWVKYTAISGFLYLDGNDCSGVAP